MGQSRAFFIWSAVKRSSIVLLAIACRGESLTAPVASPVQATPQQFESSAISAPAFLAALVNPPTALTFDTYEGSGQVVHPDVVTFDQPWHGHRMWNAITPYPNSAIRFENPSLFASDDGDNWSVPEGVKNPLSTTSRGYLSDPDMLFEPTKGELWLYYREVENRKILNTNMHIADHVWLVTSPDGIKWSTPRRVVSDTARFAVSPSIVRTAETNWSMYQIDAGKDGCSGKANRVVVRKSADGLTWRTPSAVNLVQTGYMPWHLDVQYIASRGEYWAMIAAYPSKKGCTNTSLFLATSKDGNSWTTYPAPILASGDTPQFGSAVYRSTFSVGVDDAVTIWFSGARTITPGDGKKPAVLAWSAAVSHTTVAALFARVNDKTRAASLSVTPTGGSVAMPATIVP
ncbi:MAG: sialidase family protein [Gemmatimonadaceae bacterium]